MNGKPGSVKTMNSTRRRIFIWIPLILVAAGVIYWKDANDPGRIRLKRGMTRTEITQRLGPPDLYVPEGTQEGEKLGPPREKLVYGTLENEGEGKSGNRLVLYFRDGQLVDWSRGEPGSKD